MPLPSFGGALGYKRAAHLLHRASFGPTKLQIDSFATLTATQAVALLFQQPLPDPVLPIDPETGTEWVLTGTTDANSGDTDLQEFFKGWFMYSNQTQFMDPVVVYYIVYKIVKLVLVW